MGQGADIAEVAVSPEITGLVRVSTRAGLFLFVCPGRPVYIEKKNHFYLGGPGGPKGPMHAAADIYLAQHGQRSATFLLLQSL